MKCIIVTGLARLVIAATLITTIMTMNIMYGKKYKDIRLVGRVMYDGTAYKGWQSQGHQRRSTIQDNLNFVLRRRFNSDKIHVTG